MIFRLAVKISIIQINNILEKTVLKNKSTSYTCRLGCMNLTKFSQQSVVVHSVGFAWKSRRQEEREFEAGLDNVVIVWCDGAQL